MIFVENIYDRSGERYLLQMAVSGEGHIFAAMELVCFPNEAWSAVAFEDALKNENAAVLALTTITDECAAYGVLYTAVGEGDVGNIAVLPQYRGKGLGRAMLNALINEAGSLGVERLFLEVRESNAPARGLYVSAGFEEIGKRRNYYRNPREDAVIMTLAL